MKTEKYFCLPILAQLCGYASAAPPQIPSPLQLPSTIDNDRTFPGLSSPLSNSVNESITDTLMQIKACEASKSNPTLLPTRYDNLPAEDWAYDVPNSLVTVTFSNYGISIFEACARLVITKANRDLRLHNRELDEPIGKFLDYNAQMTHVRLNAWPVMTWGNWRDTLKGLEHFVEYYHAVCFDFDVEVREDQDAQRFMVGTGIFC